MSAARILAIECGAEVDEFISFTDDELEAYTAEVKARERVRCMEVSPNDLNVCTADAPHTVWPKYREGIRRLK